jgi:glutathione peroxidase
MKSPIQHASVILFAVQGMLVGQTAGPKLPAASYAVNYAGRYRDAPVIVDGKLGPDGANQSNWNNLKSPVDVNSGGGSFTAEITDQTGGNPISLVTTCTGGAGGNDGGGPSATNFQRLYNSGLRDAGGPWHITTAEPPLPGTYDVYIYASNGGQNFGVNSGTTTTWTSTAGGASGTFDLDQNYHVFSGLTGPLKIHCGSAIAGFSIVDPNASLGPPEEARIRTIPLKDIDGNDTSLKAFEGKTVLLVNVASKSGNTPQYKGLEALYQKFRDQGLVVVGVPCNDFGSQEPGSNADIKTFCTTKYKVTFPMMEKIRIKGTGQHPLYAELCGPKSTFPGDVKWNFGKFLIGRDGKLVARFDPAITPEDPTLLKAIASDLARKPVKPAAPDSTPKPNP